MQRSSSRRFYHALFPTCGRAFWVVAVVVLLLAGCGDDDHHELEDDFIDSCLLSGGIFDVSIRRSLGEPFDLLEVGVTPFAGTASYLLEVRGIAFRDGREIINTVEGAVQAAFIDPLNAPVVDALIVCDCFVDYVVVQSPSLDVTIHFDAQTCA